MNFFNKKNTGETDQLKEKKPKKKTPDKELTEIKSEKEIKKKMIPFDLLLSEAQEYMSKKYATTLYDADKKDIIKQYIKQFIIDRNYYVMYMTLGEVAEKLYTEMAEYSFLTPFLQSKEIEEININAWNDIAVHPCNGKPYKLDRHFSSPTHCIDIMRRLLHNNKLVFDASRPIVTGYLGSNIRITATHSVVVGEDTAAASSIRIVNPQKITREQFVGSETCTEDMYDFLVMCFCYGISQCYAGGTGSGKTTLMADIMSHYPDYKRLITIEKSVREFNLIKTDENGNVLNNVLHFCTRDSDDENRNVTILKLVTAALTMHPDAICVAEMKNEEAWEAQEAARTGHTVMTTTHANSCAGVYSRLATLCLQKYSSVPFNIIVSLVVEAFPISIFLKQLDDGKRHLMEIAECIDLHNGDYKLRPLWQYEVISEEETENGKIIEGHFIKVNSITKELADRLRSNGVPRATLARFTGGC